MSGSDWSIYSEDGNLPAGCRGIVNPNYPGFQHLGPSLLSDTDDTDDERDDDELNHEDAFNNNTASDNALNRLDAPLHQLEHKHLLYDKPKLNIQVTHVFSLSLS